MYCKSQIDKDNFKWFENDGTVRSLKSVNLLLGQLRGLNPCRIDFKYPITAIAGRNGAGKSTILAMACCAYHNDDNAYLPADHNKTYYTFSDFFIQTLDEDKVGGIEISYRFLVLVKKIGIKDKIPKLRTQIRKKKQGGKWNHYNLRYNRNVAFFGIQRIVPPSERKTERSYSYRFKSTMLDEKTKKRILEIASRILGKRYLSLDLRTVNKRRLFVVDRHKKHYSGFNMGAGENAIFSVLIELFTAGFGSLLVIDEIELGLHEEAQKRFIDELKITCKELHCQIICSTHSAAILESLPLEARVFIESYEDKTNIIPDVTSNYAMGKLTGKGGEELMVYVEDEVASSIVMNSLPLSVRERISILPIGSDQAVLQHLASKYKESQSNCIAFLDGDKRDNNQSAIRQFKKNLEDRYRCSENELNEWITSRLKYLPGEKWPEYWLLSNTSECVVDSLSKIWRVDKDELVDILDKAILAGKHNEFYTLSLLVRQSIEQIKVDVIRELVEEISVEFEYIEENILELLNYK